MDNGCICAGLQFVDDDDEVVQIPEVLPLWKKSTPQPLGLGLPKLIHMGGRTPPLPSKIILVRALPQNPVQRDKAILENLESECAAPNLGIQLTTSRVESTYVIHQSKMAVETHSPGSRDSACSSATLAKTPGVSPVMQKGTGYIPLCSNLTLSCHGTFALRGGGGVASFLQFFGTLASYSLVRLPR